MSDYVILVDENDNDIGIEEKILAHQQKLLHRAFSIFLFNDNFEILLQKRAPNKYHSGNLWTNTCCSHPLQNLSLIESAKKRLIEEMGIEANLNKVFSFIYEAEFENGLHEHEFDHVLFGRFNGEPILNPYEAVDFRWITISELKDEIQNNPNKFTFWLRIIFNNYYKYFKNYENNSL
tara:strand:- start:105 stop:638 length:534 start_codon:yes stop_codon:yes gene_type:complete